MGYFDRLARGNLAKDAQGHTIFYPWGILARGRVLQDDAAERRVLSFLIRYYRISLPSIIGFVAIFGRAWWSAAPIPIVVAWYCLALPKLIAGCPYSDSKLPLKASLAHSARGYSSFALWARLFIALLFVVAGVFLMSRAHDIGQRLLALLCILFFGACAAVFGCLLRVKAAR